MMKRRLLTVLMVVLMAVPVFAADGDSALVTFLKSEAFANLMIGVVALIMATVRMRLSDENKKILDMAVGIANGIEKAIPDDTDSPKLSKMDKALRRFKRDWERLKGKKPKDAIVAAARGAIERWVADRNSGRPL
jgi:hypothetical protein